MIKRRDFDTAWKRLLVYIDQGLQIFWPQLHAAIDWEKQSTDLQQELLKVLPESDKGVKRVDKLISLYLKKGGAVWILLHVEVQGSFQEDFADRMFQYYCLLRAEHGDRIIEQLAIYTDDDPKFRPNCFKIQRFGYTIDWNFQTYKLIDHREQLIEEFCKHSYTNIFNLVMYFHLETFNCSADDQNGLMQTVRRILAGLKFKGCSKEEIRELFGFLNLMYFQVFEKENLKKLAKEIEEDKMTYGDIELKPLACFYEIFEEQAIEKGVEKGRQEGIQEGMQKGWQEGIQEGMQKGRQEGIQEGMQEGMQKGRQEGERLLKAKLAVTLLKEKHTPEQVCQWLGLSVQELNELMNG
jgi:hypothetical protein